MGWRKIIKELEQKLSEDKEYMRACEADKKYVHHVRDLLECKSDRPKINERLRSGRKVVRVDR